MNLKTELKNEIIAIAKECGVRKLILFGHRAEGTNGERSDIDLAALGGDVGEFYYRIEEETYTLLKYDVVDMNRGASEELKSEIYEKGVVIYEEV